MISAMRNLLVSFLLQVLVKRMINVITMITTAWPMLGLTARMGHLNQNRPILILASPMMRLASPLICLLHRRHPPPACLLRFPRGLFRFLLHRIVHITCAQGCVLALMEQSRILSFVLSKLNLGRSQKRCSNLAGKKPWKENFLHSSKTRHGAWFLLDVASM
jgi:hypothetical protein